MRIQAPSLAPLSAQHLLPSPGLPSVVGSINGRLVRDVTSQIGTQLALSLLEWGKAKIQAGARSILDRVTKVLTDVPSRFVSAIRTLFSSQVQEPVTPQPNTSTFFLPNFVSMCNALVDRHIDKPFDEDPFRRPIGDRDKNRLLKRMNNKMTDRDPISDNEAAAVIKAVIRQAKMPTLEQISALRADSGKLTSLHEQAIESAPDKSTNLCLSMALRTVADIYKLASDVPQAKLSRKSLEVSLPIFSLDDVKLEQLESIAKAHEVCGAILLAWPTTRPEIAEKIGANEVVTRL